MTATSPALLRHEVRAVPTVRTAMIMGLPFSIHLRESAAGLDTAAIDTAAIDTAAINTAAINTAAIDTAAIDAAVDEVWECLRWADSIFSTYRPDSDISRIRRRELTVRRADPAVAEVLDFADTARRMTGGTFDVRGAGSLDPSGIVKGWAASRAARTLAGLGVDHYLNAGGDVLVHQAAPDGPARPWRIGIEHPDDPRGLLTVVELRTGAVATSGRSHRGAHIWDPATGRPAAGIAQATVVGPSLIWADILATAVVAGGLDRVDSSHWPTGHEVLLATDDGRIFGSPGFRRFLAADLPVPPITDLR